MDSILANSQSNLAHKQRELAKLTEFQLPRNPHLNLGESQHFHETEELFKMTRDIKNDLENRVPLSDPIAQIQQKKIQLLIAERQYTVAESQIRIIQGHILSGMDPGRSALSRTSDMKTTDELQKQAQPLLNEAAELLKKARHSVTFAELGARQRMGSYVLQQHQHHYRDGAISPEPYSSPEPEPELSPPPQNHHQRHEIDHVGATAPVAVVVDVDQYREETPAPRSPVVVMPRDEEVQDQGHGQRSYPSDRGPLVDKKKESRGCSRCCCMGFIVFLVLCLIVGGVIYALIAYDVIKF